MRLQRLAVARFLRLQPLQPLQPLRPFLMKPFPSTFAVPLHPFCLLPFVRPLSFLCIPCIPFCRPFALKHLQRSFHTVFKRFLSGLFIACVHLHRLNRFVRLYSPILPIFAVLRGM